jgi:hypothetical protein
MHVYPALRVKEWVCSSDPLTRTQVEEAETLAEKNKQEEDTALAEAQASGGLDAEIWERIIRNPKDTMTTEHKRYLGLPWHRWSGVIHYTAAKALLEAKKHTQQHETVHNHTSEPAECTAGTVKGEEPVTTPNNYQPNVVAHRL